MQRFKRLVSVLLAAALLAALHGNASSATVVAFTAPGTVITRGSVVTVSIRITSDTQIVAYGLSAPGSLTGCVDTITGFDIDLSCQWSVPNKPKASYTLRAFAQDRLGNQSEAALTGITSR